MGVVSHSCLVLFGDNRSLRFWCVNFGWRTFNFLGGFMKKKFLTLFALIFVFVALVVLGMAKRYGIPPMTNTERKYTVVTECLTGTSANHRYLPKRDCFYPRCKHGQSETRFVR